jgi:hypothetical protein
MVNDKKRSKQYIIFFIKSSFYFGYFISEVFKGLFYLVAYMKIDTKPKLFYLAVFAVITCLLQAVLQIQPIDIYHPSGFEFPLIIISDKILSTEFRREICAIFMLVLASSIFGLTPYQRFSYLILSFIIWNLLNEVGLIKNLKYSSALINRYSPPKRILSQY